MVMRKCWHRKTTGDAMSAHRLPPARATLRGRRSAVIIAALLAAGAPPVAAEVVTLTAVRDNTLFEDASGSLSNGDRGYSREGTIKTQFAGRWFGSTWRESFPRAPSSRARCSP